MTSRFTTFFTPKEGKYVFGALLSRKAGWRAFITVLFCLSIWPPTRAQENIRFTQGAVGTGLENSLSVQLPSYPGRGAASLPVSLYYSTRGVWRLDNLATVNDGNYQSIVQAIYAEHSMSGWTTSLDLPIIEWPKETDEYYYSGKTYCYICQSNFRHFRVARVYILMQDGSRHELRMSDQPYEGPIDMVGTFYAVDGSRLRYDSTGANTGTLYLPDGTRYILNGSTAQYIDRNGNTLNYNSSNRQWTDTLGRVLGMPWPTSPQAGQDYSYQLPGFGGNSSITYTLRWKYLADALTPDPNTGQPPTRKPIAYDYLPYPNLPPTNYQGNNHPISLGGWGSERPSLFISDGDEEAPYTIVVGKGQVQNALFNPVVLTEIVLPNGLSYKFSYNNYGEMGKIIYPTGAFEMYQVSEVPTTGDVVTPFAQTSRGVTSRKLSSNGTGNDLVEWLYSTTGGTITTKTPNDHANGIFGTQTETYRQFIEAPWHGTQPQRYWAFGFEDGRNGAAFDERVYALNVDGTRGAILRRKLTKYEQTYNPVPPRIGLPGEATETAYRNVRPNKEVSLILDTGGYALAKTMTFSYDATYQLTTGLDLLASTEGQFADVDQSTAQAGTIDTISPGTGTIARSAETTYLNSSTYRDRNILGLATVSVVKDAAGSVVAKSETHYDESAYPLLTYSDLNNVPDYTNPNTTVRGNVTTTRRYYDIANGLYLESHAQYDQCGNARNAWNERGVQSETEYSSTYKHAYATQSTTAPPDPSGTHGSNAPFTSSRTFDYTTGVTLSVTDAIGQTANFSYLNDQGQVDPLNRLRKVTRPDGGWTKTVYNDAIGNFYVYTEMQQDTSRVSKGYQYFDAMGRPFRAYACESGTTFIISDRQYDKMGRVSRVSILYRGALGSAINPSNQWTSRSYDALGRTTAVTFSDTVSNWTAQTEYQGIYSTATDEALKKRRQKVDALGRIVRVDEPDASGNLGSVDAPAQTNVYDYDTLGNLIHITQGGNSGQLQHRYFKYDALSRLTYERQVEQAAPHTAADPLNSQWSRRIVYDEGDYKGLVTSMYDARNIQTQYKYDQLNRLWQVTHNDGTPTVTSNYDQARTGYLNKGKLTEVITAAVGDIPQTSQVYDFDLMGRVVKQTQTIDTNSYALRYAYNLGSQLIQATYPSGRVINFGFDEASRLSNINGGNGHNFISAMTYTPQGTLSSATLGNNAIYTYGYNSRMQLASLQASRSSTVLQKYEYKYGQANLGNDSVDETKNNGQIGRMESSIGTQKQWQQRFVYDSLGRLITSGEYRGDNSQQTYQLNFSYDVFANRYQYQAANSSNPSSLNQKWVEPADIDKATNRFTSGVTYDAAGNVTADPRFRNLEYQYDANGRMKQSSQPNGVNPVKAIFDGAGQRVATKFNGALAIMVYDAMGKLVAEYGQTAPATASIQYIMADHQGSTRLVTDRSGAVYSRHDYQPFGEELNAGIGMRTTDQKFNMQDNVRQKYTGMETDDATGMAHTHWRKYDGQSGRWTSPDPYGGSMTIADPQSFNRYTYVNNDPVNLTDPSGLTPYGAEHGWSDVENGFWGSYFDFNAPHFGGPEVIGGALKSHDNSIDKPLADLRVSLNAGGLAFGNYRDPDTVRVYTFAFWSREQALHYYREYFGVNFTFSHSVQSRIDGLRSAETPYVQSRPSGSSGPAVQGYSPSGGGLFGVTYNPFAGIGYGGVAAGNIGVSGGINTNGNGGVGAAGSGGVVFGGSSVGGSFGYPSQEGWGIGAAVSVTPGVFWSNAESFSDLQGDFTTTVIATPLVTIGIDSSGSTELVSVSGPSGLGIFHYTTHTPQGATADVPVLIPLRNY